MTTRNQRSFAKETLTIGATPVRLSSEVYAPVGGTAAKSAVIQCTKAAVRYWLTSAIPTSSEGLILLPYTLIVVDTATDIGSAVFVRDEDATEDGVLEIQYQH